MRMSAQGGRTSVRSANRSFGSRTSHPAGSSLRVFVAVVVSFVIVYAVVKLLLNIDDDLRRTEGDASDLKLSEAFVGREREKERERQTDRRTDGQTDRRTDGQTESSTAGAPFDEILDVGKH